MPPAFRHAVISAAVFSPCLRIAVQIVLRPTPKHEQTVGPVSTPLPIGCPASRPARSSSSSLPFPNRSREPCTRRQRQLGACRHEDATLDTPVDQMHGAIDARRPVLILQPVGMRIVDAEQRVRPAAVIGERLASREFVAHELRAVDTRPVASCRPAPGRGGSTRNRARRRRNLSTRTGVCLNSGSPETGSTVGIHHRADPRVGRHLIVPVNRHEHAAARHATAMLHTCDHRAPTARHAREFSFAHAARQRVLRMQSTNASVTWPASFSDLPVRVIVCHWSRTRPVFSVSGYSPSGAWTGARGGVATKRALPSACAIAAITEETRGTARRGAVHREYRPLDGLQRVVTLAAKRDEPAQIEHTLHIAFDVLIACFPLAVSGLATAASVVTVSTQPRMLIENLMRRRKIKAGIPHALRDVADDPPVGARFARAGRNARWREMLRSELVTVPSFSPQPSAGSSTCANAVVSVLRDNRRRRRARSARARASPDRHRAGSQPDSCAMIQTALIRPACDRLEQLDRLESRPCWRCAGSPRKSARVSRCRGLSSSDVRGQHVREAAHFAPAHRVRLAGHRERPHARLADAAGQQMAVDDAVDLVGAGGRLVHALREDRDDALGAREESIELVQIVPVDAAGLRALREIDPFTASRGGIERLRRAVSCARRRSRHRSRRVPRRKLSRPLNSRTSVPA